MEQTNWCSWHTQSISSLNRGNNNTDYENDFYQQNPTTGLLGKRTAPDDTFAFTNISNEFEKDLAGEAVSSVDSQKLEAFLADPHQSKKIRTRTDFEDSLLRGTPSPDMLQLCF